MLEFIAKHTEEILTIFIMIIFALAALSYIFAKRILEALLKLPETMDKLNKVIESLSEYIKNHDNLKQSHLDHVREFNGERKFINKRLDIAEESLKEVRSDISRLRDGAHEIRSEFATHYGKSMLDRDS